MKSWLRRFGDGLFTGDVLYTVLPIIVYAIVRLTYRHSFHDFLGLPEWSFASIVFYGLSIRRTTELRRIYISLSHQLSIRIQIFVFLLIASVLALSLAIVSEDDKNTNHFFIVSMQQVFFLGGILSLIKTINTTEWFILNSVDKNRVYFFWEDLLTIADERLYTLLDSVNWLDRERSKGNTGSGELEGSERESDELRLILQRIDNSIGILNQAQKKISLLNLNSDDSLGASGPPKPNQSHVETISASPALSKE